MSPAIPGDYISDLDPIQSVTQLAGGLFEVELLAGPVAGAYVSRRLTTEQLVAYLLTQGLGGPLSPFQTVRFRTRAEANAPGAFGGAVLEEFDYSTLFTYARVQVEFWRDNPADLNEKPRGQALIAVYDPNAPANHMGYATSGGPAAGVSKLGLKLVFPDDPAATGVLPYDAAQAVKKTQLRYYDDGQGVEFYEALQDMVSPVPTPVRGTPTAYWKPTAKPPVPGGGAPVANLYYTIDEAKDKRDNGQLPDGRPTAAINDVWNGVGDNIVYLEVLETGRWAKYGQLLDAQGNWSFVEVDLDNATAVPATASLQTQQQHTQQLSANSSLISSLIANKLEVGSLRQVVTLDAARNAIANATLTAGASYTVLGLWNGVSGGVALLAGSRNAFHPIGFIGDSSGNATAVVASVVAGTFELLSDYVKRLAGSGGGGNVSVDGVTIVQDGAGVISAVVRNDLVFRTTIGGQQTSGPYYISRLEAGNYQSQNTNPGVLNYSVSVNGAVVAGARFSLAENDVLVVNYQADVNGAVFTLRTI